MRVGFAMALLMSTTPAHAAELDAETLRGELVGQLIQWWENDGWHSGHLKLWPDGRADLMVDAPEKASDGGHWAIRGNQICTTWASLRAGDQKCYSVEQLSPTRFITSGGNVFEIVTAGA
jgi:hypothetical protein